VADEAELAPVLARSSHFGILLEVVTPPVAQPRASEWRPDDQFLVV